ncbi:rCG60886 [Rattus norvegicus]|uniref:RCG60886 n=1 Tax=Rattus norvegicus TaxID=10116 RepID=A6JKV6_RAT|nr:rCG60886 [Rattus norvegicus]
MWWRSEGILIGQRWKVVYVKKRVQIKPH